MNTIKSTFILLRDAGIAWKDDKATRIAAALAYYTIFSLAPLLMITVIFVGMFFGERAAKNEIAIQLETMVGPDLATFIQSLLVSTAQPTSANLASVVSLGVILFGASGIFLQLQDALNTIWHVEPEEAGILALIKQRIFLFMMAFSLGFVLILSIAANVLVSILVRFLYSSQSFLVEWLEEYGILEWLANEGISVEMLLQIFNVTTYIPLLTYFISFLITAFLFAILFKFLPNIDVSWGDVWGGALFTAVLFGLGTFGLSIYFSRSSVGSVYGVAGSLVTLLAWIYYSGMVFLYGAEVTKLYIERFRRKPKVLLEVTTEPASQTENSESVSFVEPPSTKTSSSIPQPFLTASGVILAVITFISGLIISQILRPSRRN